MLRILESQAPAKQTATDTINTLSSRLSSATLLEDRRAAILGLRSFAKQYPASVASGALRDLTAALRKDGEDSDTTKVVLETILMLFEPDEKSPEASEEITLWLADEFAQRQENITALLDLLDTGEFYLRLYSLQILSHVCALRPQRSQEVVLAAPLGVSRVVAVLDDKREAVRNEALLLLVSLTPSNAELQKVVAFENAFDRIFTLIAAEGGLTHGSTSVQDCLSLLANLLSLNTSNQSYFREIGCIPKVSNLLADVLKEENSPDGVSDWIRGQRDMNLWGMLGVMQLFLVQGSQGTNLSQVALWQSKVLLRALQIAFDQGFATNVRSKALEVCGDIIRKNARLQEQFGDLSVPLPKQQPAITNGHVSPGMRTPGDGRSGTTAAAIPQTQITNVIEALLELTLEPASLAMFDVRLAASSCMKAFMEGHNGIRGHVLRRAIEGHKSGNDAIPNILTVLLEPSRMRSNSDPYQVWMASVLLLHILHDNPETKTMALKVQEGNAEEGEEVVTFIQSLSSNIIAGVLHVEDERALLGYLMLLCIWLFEDPESVDDFLNEGSSLTGLAAAAKVAGHAMPLVAGLCCLLLGIVYEFSTKDSPIPRATLQGVLSNDLSRDLYIDRLTKLRESPFVRDFEVMPASGDGPLPDVYFDKMFMDFLKDNFSRLLRAIDRDPNFETSFVANGVQKGISRELVDGLRAELEEHKRQLQSSQAQLVQLQQKFETEELEHRRTRESTSVELSRIKQINESLHRNHDDEMQRLQKDAQQRETTLTRSHENALAQLRRDQLQTLEDTMTRHTAEKKYLEQRTSGHEREIKRMQEKLAKQHAEELEQATSEAIREQQRLRAEITTLQSSLEDTKFQLRSQTNSHNQEIQTLHKEHERTLTESKIRASQAAESLNTAESRAKAAESKLATLESRLTDFQSQLSSAQATSKTFDTKLKEAQSKAKKAEDLARSLTDKLKSASSKSEQAETDLKTIRAELQATVRQIKSMPQKKDPTADTAATAKALAEADAKVKTLESELEEARAQAGKAKEVQTELDDLLVVFADLEAKRAADKKRLKELGEEVSEDEGDGEDDVDVDEEDEDDEGVD